MVSTDPRIAALRRRLAHFPATAIPPRPEVTRAAVALVVRPEAADLELLLIKRSAFVGDPWSGHMAFPGGRSDPEDASVLVTAMRETREEVLIDLATHGTLLGRLDDVQPGNQTVRIVVSPFIFAVPPGSAAAPSHEVAATVWIPMRELLHPGAVIEYLHEYGGTSPLRFPALGFGEYVIWGLTHRILTQFLELAAPVREAGRFA